MAHILVYSVPEFEGMTPQEVVPLIEADEPNNEPEPEIAGNSTESFGQNGSSIDMDIKFYVSVPDRTGYIKLIINVEQQNDFTPGYDILTRAMYYSAKALSDQLGVEFKAPEYDKIKKVYSIWLCMDVPKYAGNTLTRYSMAQHNMVGCLPDRFRYDVQNVIIIGVSKKLAEEKDELKLHRLLGVLFSKSMPVVSRKEILREEYSISMTQEMERKVAEHMSLSEGIYKNGVEEGIKEGIEQVAATLREKGMSEKEISEIIQESRDRAEEKPLEV